MARFVFQLDGVLRQRRQVERQRQRELAIVQAKMTALRRELEDLGAAVRKVEQDLRENRLLGQLNLPFLAAHRRFSFAMQRKALAIGQQMAVVQREVDQASGRLLEAVEGRKAIERLRERHWDRWKAEQGRKERIEFDEIGAQMFMDGDDQLTGAIP